MVLTNLHLYKGQCAVKQGSIVFRCNNNVEHCCLGFLPFNMKSLTILALLPCLFSSANADDVSSFGLNFSVFDEVISVAKDEVRSHCKVWRVGQFSGCFYGLRSLFATTANTDWGDKLYTICARTSRAFKDPDVIGLTVLPYSIVR